MERSAAKVRGEIESEVSKELQQAQLQIDEARRMSTGAEAARDEAQARAKILASEKDEALSRARTALRAKETAEAELKHLVAQRRKQAVVVEKVESEVKRLEGVLADREATAASVEDESGVASAEKVGPGK